jgi:hypothetical protein
MFVCAACLPEPKTGCRTTDDCVHNRVCVAGTCRAAGSDASLDASPDRPSVGPDRPSDSATDSAKPGFDLSGARDEQSDLAGMVVEARSDASSDVPMGWPDGLVAPDALPESPTPDAAPKPDGTPDRGAAALDAEPDVPVSVPLDGSDSAIAVDSTFEAPPTADAPSDAPDAAPPPIDPSPDAPVTGLFDAPEVDSPPPGIDVPILVSWEDFRARSPREPWAGGRHIVDGDLAFDEAGLRRYYEAWFTAASAPPHELEPMGAAGLWPFPDSVSLSYCVSSDFGDKLAVVESAMLIATASWSDQAGVGYTYLPEENSACDAANSTVMFDVRPVSDVGYLAVAFFPGSPRLERSLLIDESRFVADADGLDLAGALRHQLGHTLGFQHEHLWLDPACTSEDSQLAVRIANYDIDSVMHLPACRPGEQGGTIQTEGDLLGAITLYGLSPALIGTIAM